MNAGAPTEKLQPEEKGAGRRPAVRTAKSGARARSREPAGRRRYGI